MSGLPPLTHVVDLPALAAPVVTSPLIDLDLEHALVRIPGVATYRTSIGGPTEVRLEPGATDSDLRCFAAGPVLAAGLLVSGIISLRGAAVQVGDGAVVLVGQPAAGKSALTATLARRGYPILADKVVPVVDAAMVEATAGAAELWPDTASALGLADGGRVVRECLAKQAYALGPSAPSTLVPVRAVVVLHTDPRLDEVTVEELEGGLEKLRALPGWVWHRRLLGPFGAAARQLDRLGAVADVAQMARVGRPPGGSTYEAVADLVEGVLR